MKSISKRIFNRIRAKRPGWIFTPNAFTDITTSRAAIDQSLYRLVKNNKIIRIIRGVYYNPVIDLRLGRLSPNINNIAKALAESKQARIHVSGALAANMLGLSNQVPAKIVYYTDSNIKNRKIGDREIIFKKVSPKKLFGAGKITGLIFGALDYIGKDNIDDNIISKLSNRLNEKDKKEINRNMRAMHQWMRVPLSQVLYS